MNETQKKYVDQTCNDIFKVFDKNILSLKKDNEIYTYDHKLEIIYSIMLTLSVNIFINVFCDLKKEEFLSMLVTVISNFNKDFVEETCNLFNSINSQSKKDFSH